MPDQADSKKELCFCEYHIGWSGVDVEYRDETVTTYRAHRRQSHRFAIEYCPKCGRKIEPRICPTCGRTFEHPYEGNIDYESTEVLR